MSMFSGAVISVIFECGPDGPSGPGLPTHTKNRGHVAFWAQIHFHRKNKCNSLILNTIVTTFNVIVN